MAVAVLWNAVKLFTCLACVSGQAHALASGFVALTVVGAVCGAGSELAVIASRVSAEALSILADTSTAAVRNTTLTLRANF